MEIIRTIIRAIDFHIRHYETILSFPPERMNYILLSLER